MRDKEEAQDYRYFPEPDLVAIRLSDQYVEDIRKTLPELPESRKARYMSEYKLSEKDARLLTASKYLSNLFEEAEKIAKRNNIHIEYVTGKAGLIGALAAIGLYNSPEEYAKVYSDE